MGERQTFLAELKDGVEMTPELEKILKIMNKYLKEHEIELKKTVILELIKEIGGI